MKLKRRLGIFLTLILLFVPMIPVSAGVEADLIRVGLSSFNGKSSLTIGTGQLSIGYCVDNSFTKMATFISNSGFQFTPAKGYYYITNNTYRNYSDVSQMIGELTKNYKVDAYACMVGDDAWKIYLGGLTSKADVTAMLSLVEGRYDLTYGAISADNGYRVKMASDGVSILYDGKAANMYPQIVSESANDKGVKTLALGTSLYRGRIEIGRYGGKSSLTAVGVLPVNEYLYGVIPAEMPSSWSSEALKAQAVVARTYAVSKASYNGNSNIASGYKINDTTASQVYKGYNGEAASGNKAVLDTKKKLIYYENKLIDATFFSTSGGATANSEDVWVSALGYLRGVPDLYEMEPAKKPWTVTYSSDQIKSKLAAKSINIGTIKDVVEEIRTDSLRVYALRIVGSSQSASIQQTNVSSYLGLPSTKFKVIKKGDQPDKVSVIDGSGKTSSKRISGMYTISAGKKVEKASTSLDQYVVKGSTNMSNYPRVAPTKANTYSFAGMGFGHGVGMSQSGANGMAKAGYSYTQIIKHYYTGVTIK